MSAFTQDFSISQSDDCSTVYLQDTSNFGNNTEGYVYSSFTTKQFQIYDSTDNLLATIPVVDNTPVSYTITKDLYLRIVYTLSSGGIPIVKTRNTALSCFVNLKYGTIVSIDYNNTDQNTPERNRRDDEDRLFNIMKGIKAAQVFASVANATASQDMLDYANSYTDTFIITP